MWHRQHKQKANPAEGIARLRGCSLGGRNSAFWTAVLAEEAFDKGEPKVAPIRHRMPPEQLELARKVMRESNEDKKGGESWEARHAKMEAVTRIFEGLGNMHPDDAMEIREAWAEGSKSRQVHVEYARLMMRRESVFDENARKIVEQMEGAEDGKKRDMIIGMAENPFYFPLLFGWIPKLPKEMQKEVIVAALKAKNSASLLALPLVCEQEETHYAELYALFVEFMGAAMQQGRMKIGFFSDVDLRWDARLGEKALSFLPAMSEAEQAVVMRKALGSKRWVIRAAAIRLIPSQPGCERRWMMKEATKSIKRALRSKGKTDAVGAFSLAMLRPEAERQALVKYAIRKARCKEAVLAAIAEIHSMPEKERKGLCAKAHGAVAMNNGKWLRDEIEEKELQAACEKLPYELKKRVAGQA